MSKARNLSNLVTTNNSITIPAGSTEDRPATPSVGMLRYNTTIGFFEIYDSIGWGTVSSPPSISSVSPTSYNGEQGTQFTVNGSAFDSNSTVKFITSQGAEYSASSVSFINSTQLLATTSQDFTVAQEPLTVKVVNGAGLSSVLTQAIDCGGVPTWNTAAGTLATYVYPLNTTYSVSLSASDPDAGSSISYSVTSGALPDGALLNANTGAITGTISNPGASSVTSNFDVSAIDNAGNASVRSFNIIRQWQDGSTSAKATTPYILRNTLGVTTNGTYWINTTGLGQTSPIQATVNFNMVDSKDWVLMTWINQTSNNNGSLVGTDWLGSSTPFTGFCLDWSGTYYYSYFSSTISYVANGGGTLSTGGNKSGYQLFLGYPGGMGWYNATQGVCSWSNSSGSVGAGYDGSCGTYPTSLRFGTGTGGANYTLGSGQFKFWIYMGNFT